METWCDSGTRMRRKRKFYTIYNIHITFGARMIMNCGEYESHNVYMGIYISEKVDLVGLTGDIRAWPSALLAVSLAIKIWSIRLKPSIIYACVCRVTTNANWCTETYWFGIENLYISIKITRLTKIAGYIAWNWHDLRCSIFRCAVHDLTNEYYHSNFLERNNRIHIFSVLCMDYGGR